MQDRFKFRFWHKSYKKIFNVTQIDFSLSLIMCNTDLGLEECHISEGNLVQCTGLKDKNGKLIYEGDILKISYGKYGEDKQRVYWDNNNANFILKDNEFAANAFCESYTKEYEIIGNIYENSELLN